MNIKEKLFNAPVGFYGVLRFILFFSELFFKVALNRISKYAGYTIFDSRLFTLRYGGWLFFIIIPVTVVLVLGQYAVSGKRTTAAFLINTTINILAISLLTVLFYNTVNKAVDVYTRYSHVVAKGNERYEIVERDDFYFGFDYDNGRHFNSGCIVYIYDEDNINTKVDDYIYNLSLRQPLKIVKVELKNAGELAQRAKRVLSAPTVLLILEGNVEALTGYEEIQFLESKIHYFKQNNIYFY